MIGPITTIRKGLGFFKNPDGENNDIIIESNYLNTAINSDIVEIKLGKKNQYGQQTGEVIKIFERNKLNLMMRLHSS